MRSSRGHRHIGQTFLTELDGDETEVRASVTLEADGWWGGHLIGPVDRIRIASSAEPFFELGLPDGRTGACFVREFGQADTTRRITIALVGTAPRRSLVRVIVVSLLLALPDPRRGDRRLRVRGRADALADGTGPAC
jgi:hypothetical protein